MNKQIMNERIRELVKQAHDIEKNTLYFICPTMGPDVAKQVSREEEIRLFNYEKFADLIVRECITVLDENDGALHHTELLKKYFGVEE
jgi:hypothetical protein